MLFAQFLEGGKNGLLCSLYVSIAAQITHSTLELFSEFITDGICQGFQIVFVIIVVDMVLSGMDSLVVSSLSLNRILDRNVCFGVGGGIVSSCVFGDVIPAFVMSSIKENAAFIGRVGCGRSDGFDGVFSQGAG